ncbi:MAG: O-antigen ligase family protein [Lachnospiraceae bacterium]|nr:O-antigen ligase family protein [Lachnospiraceae bacterium]
MNKRKLYPSGICLMILLMFYPLIFSKAYSGILEIKYLSFIIIATTMIYFYAMERLILCNLSSLKASNILQSVKTLSLTDISMLIFLLICILSVIFSDYRIEAFTGSCSNNMGLIYYIALVSVYFVVSRINIRKKYIFIACMISFSIIIIFSFIQFMGYDLFNLIGSINDDLRINYLSTLGNTNIYSAFLCLFTPVFMACAVLSRKLKLRSYFYAMSFLGYIGLFTANSDGGYAGFFTAFVLVLLIAVNYKERIIRFLYLCFLYCISTCVFLFFHNIFSDTARPLSDITKFMVYGSATKILLILFVILIVIVDRFKSKIKNEDNIRNISRFAIIAFLIMLALLFIASNVDKVFSLGILDRYFKFTNDWGTGRGYVWKWCLNIFGEGTLINKLFGFGTGTCSIELLSAYSHEMRYSLGYYFTTAHNEFLEILLNVGILGLLSYISVIIATIVKNIKNREYFNIQFTVGIIAYCIQSMFIAMQPVVIPLVFVFLGLANNIAIDKERI